ALDRDRDLDRVPPGVVDRVRLEAEQVVRGRLVDGVLDRTLQGVRTEQGAPGVARHPLGAGQVHPVRRFPDRVAERVLAALGRERAAVRGGHELAAVGGRGYHAATALATREVYM